MTEPITASIQKIEYNDHTYKKDGCYHKTPQAWITITINAQDITHLDPTKPIRITQ